MTFEKNTSAGFLANHMARLFASALSKRIQPLGLAPAQFMVLLELWAKDGRTQAELVERLSVEQATMANTLSRMVRDGLIEMRPSPIDKRAKLVSLSDAARALQGPATEAAEAVNRKALEGLDEPERAQLIAAMQKVISNLC